MSPFETDTLERHYIQVTESQNELHEYEFKEEAGIRFPKLAVIVGHNSLKGGFIARGSINRNEYNFNSRVAWMMSMLASEYDIRLKIFHRTTENAIFLLEMVECYSRVNKWDPNATLELHFNGFKDKEVGGTEVLSSGSNGSMAFAGIMQKHLCTLFGRSGKGDRGVKAVSQNDRGGLAVHLAKAPSILTEPFFASNPEDLELADQLGMEKLARAYLAGAAEYFNQ